MRNNDTGKNRGNWNHLKIIQTIPEQNTGKALHQGTTVNSHTGHCTHTAGSTDVKCNTFNMGSNITCYINCNYRTAATIYTPETWVVSGVYFLIICKNVINNNKNNNTVLTRELCQSGLLRSMQL